MPGLRNVPRVQDTLQVSTFAMQGGLDEVSPYVSIPPGRVIDAVNYEVLQKGGYGRIYGYTLFDGSDSPAAVPGDGIVRGIHVHMGDVYAVRDDAGVGKLYVSSSSGWTEITTETQLKFTSGDTDLVVGGTITGGTSGATGTVAKIQIKTGTLAGGDAEGLLVLTSVSGTFTDTEVLSIGGSDAANANGTQSAIAFPDSGDWYFVSYNFFGSAASERMYFVSGQGPAYEYDGTYVTPIDLDLGTNPTRINAYSNHLVLGFAEGSVIFSTPDDPLDFDTDSGGIEIAVGDEVNNLHIATGNALVIGCRNSIHVLQGTLAANFQLARYAEYGTVAETMHNILDQVFMVTDTGVQSLVATDAFNNFASQALSNDVRASIVNDIRVNSPIRATVSRAKDQYRLFFGKKGYYFTFDGRRLVGIMPVVYTDTVQVIANGVDSNDRSVEYFGSDDGKVMKMDDGYTFNGTNIQSALRCPFIFDRSPTRRKHYRRVQLFIDVTGANPALFCTTNFNFGAPDSPASQLVPILLTNQSGDSWDTADWDTAEWGLLDDTEAVFRIDGTGQNFSMTFFNDGSQSGVFSLLSATVHWTPRRLNRG